MATQDRVQTNVKLMRLILFVFSESERYEAGESSKPEWVKAAVLHEMLLEIQDFTSKEIDVSHQALEEGALSRDPNNSYTEKQALAMANGRPVFTITPPINHSFTEGSAVSPGEVVVGMHGSDSAPNLQPNGMRSRDSRESLIPEEHKETWLTILAQVCIPFIIAGLGMVGAGLILDQVKAWKVFKEVPEFIVLVTPLLGLKGNLEMTLASRLSTHANLGHMDSPQNQWHICAGNLSLTQVQAIVVGFLASVVAIIMGLIKEEKFVLQNAFLLCASSMLTAAIASCALGILMVAVIVLSKKLNINPDNVATPIAASLGDVTTLGLLAWLASILYEELDAKPWLSPSIIGAYILVTPLWIWISHKNEYTKQVLITGWPPVLTAMLISSGGGLILDLASAKFEPMALYQPVINGVGGNLVSVQASRISTALHRNCQMGELPGKLPGAPNRVWVSPWTVFCRSGVDSTAARVLLGIVIPGHFIFATVTHFVSSSESNYTVVFLGFYLLAALTQVAFLLYIAQLLINWLWTRKLDPDTSTIPYLTALGDLIGTGLLYLAFEIQSVF
ncbi:unnamed protein product [Allacma fusca]|uniref:SLC41A/MgtE integral membrane domain-containing protein n=1 Tax=Allacma fusca TaxID=39272 RepID=A0A8J2L3J4_9HEXA|nr:unnamed protein product [Allacma fusca]